MAYSKDAVFKASQSLGESNDCSVKALALTTKLTYTKAHGLLALAGRMPNRGVNTFQIREAIREAGYDMVEVTDKITAKTVTTLPRDKAIKKSNKYLVFVRGHVLAVRNKEVLDWTAGRRHQIQQVFQVV